MEDISRKDVFVIVPAYDEASVILRVVKELQATGYAIIVVDDGSTDGTGDLAASQGAFVLRHPINIGQGAALQTGLEFALTDGADIIVTFDADGQHRVGDVHLLIAALEKHAADFALGSRFIGRTVSLPKLRRIMLKAATWLTRKTTGLNVTDTHNGLRAMTRRGASRIHLSQSRMAHASELLSQVARSGLPYVEVPVTVEYSPYSLRKGQKLSDSLVVLVDLVSHGLLR